MLRILSLLTLFLSGQAALAQGDLASALARARNGPFGEPRRVVLRGYDGDAMEPFVTRDGRYLLFNDKNDPSSDAKLRFAERVDDLTFDYQGLIQGVDTDALEGVPSVDERGNLYFVSTRSYRETLSTLYRGRFDAGRVSNVELVAGVSQHRLGMINFDAEISADGDTLLFNDGRFAGRSFPAAADITIAVREGTGFRRLPNARDLLREVNSDHLEYAPAISRDLLELFFTRLEWIGSSPRTEILRAMRSNAEQPFGRPLKVPSITGFVEGPTLSADERALYYHKRQGGHFVIFCVTR